MKIRQGWSSHIPMLIKALELTEGDVLEMGVGMFSTPLLHWMCMVNNRNLYSYEHDNGWISIKRHFESDNHKIIMVDDWDKADIDREWGMAFIDHAPAERRHIDIERLADKAKLIVVHDTEEKNNKTYKYNKIYPLFKYRYDFKIKKPYTTILSNYIQLI